MFKRQESVVTAPWRCLGVCCVIAHMHGRLCVPEPEKLRLRVRLRFFCDLCVKLQKTQMCVAAPGVPADTCLLRVWGSLPVVARTHVVTRVLCASANTCFAKQGIHGPASACGDSLTVFSSYPCVERDCPAWHRWADM